MTYNDHIEPPLHYWEYVAPGPALVTDTHVVMFGVSAEYLLYLLYLLTIYRVSTVHRLHTSQL